MRRLLLVGVVLIVSSATGQEPASKLWSDLKAKRQMLPGLHQEFEVSRTSSALGSSRTYHQKFLSMSPIRDGGSDQSAGHVTVFESSMDKISS